MKKLHKAHLSALGGRLYGVQYVSGLMQELVYYNLPIRANR